MPRQPYDEVEDVLAVLDLFEVGSATVIGASSGAELAVNVALAHPERIDRLVLVSPVVGGIAPSAHFLERNLRNLRPLYAAGDVEAAIRLWVEDRWLTAGEGSARDTVADVLAAFPQNLTVPFQLARKPDRPAVGRLAEIDAPTLIIVGEDDIPDIHAHAGGLEAGIEQAHRVVLPGGHLVHLESPELFDAEVRAFLASPEEQAQAILAAVEERPIKELRGIFEYDRFAPLEVEEHATETRDGAVRVIDLSFASPVAGRVTAYLILPPGPGPFPAVLFLHPGQGDRSTFVDEAEDLARRGIASLSIDAPQVRPEPWRRTDSFFAAEESRQVVVQTVIDLRRSLDVLGEREEIDGARIAYVGRGLGASLGGVLCGVEDRVLGYVLAGGHPVTSHVWSRRDHLMQAAFRTLLEPEQQEQYLALHRYLDAAHYLPHAAPARLLLQFAEHDGRVTRADALACLAAASEPKELRWYSNLDGQARSDRQVWLTGLLGDDDTP